MFSFVCRGWYDGFPGMHHIFQVAKKAFHQADRGSLMIQKRSKRAKDIINVIHDSSLTSKERRRMKSKPSNFSHDRMPVWKTQKLAISKKLNGERWNPSKKLSREEMEGLRLIKSQFPHLNASELGKHFGVSPEVVRRILSSKWRPSEEEMNKLHQRWKRRGERIKHMLDSQKRLAVRKRLVINTLGSSPSVVASIRSTKPADSNKKSKSKLYLLRQQQ